MNFILVNIYGYNFFFKNVEVNATLELDFFFDKYKLASNLTAYLISRKPNGSGNIK